MNVSWNHGDLPTRQRGGHLRLVTSEERADSLGAGRARSSGATVPSLPRRGAHLTETNLADLEQLAQICARMEAATASLMKAVRKRDLADAQEAARAILHIGLKAGDVSRHMERSA